MYLISYSPLLTIHTALRDCRPEDEFQCTMPRQCIPKSFVCDAFPDCEDKTDESKCGSSGVGKDEISSRERLAPAHTL